MKSAGKPVLLVLSAATVVLFGVASFLPDERLWGLNHLAFFAMPLRLALLALVAICFIPPFARLLLEGFLSATSWLTRPGRNTTITLLAVKRAVTLRSVDPQVSPGCAPRVIEGTLWPALMWTLISVMARVAHCPTVTVK